MLFHNAKKMSEMLTHPVLKETFNTIKEYVKDTHLSPDGNGYVVPVRFTRDGEVISCDLHVMERWVRGSLQLQVIVPVDLTAPGSLEFFPPTSPHLPSEANWTIRRKNGNLVKLTMVHEAVNNYLLGTQASNNHQEFVAMINDVLNTAVISHSRLL